MSSSTVFMALQCCQCSIMQVKQKKKSSNKWSCAVCNQKQSVRKVFAQGFMAKHIRQFVQSFNMSGESLDDATGTLDPLPEPEPEFPDNPTPKRTDWTSYLDHEDHHTTRGGEQEHDGDDSEPRVVTELHKGMFKKRRLVENSTGLGGGGSDKHFKKPAFTSSQGSGMEIKLKFKEGIKDQGRTSTAINSERNNYLISENWRAQKCKPTISRVASKWNDYVTEDNVNLEFGWKQALRDHYNSVLEAITSDQSVEDDIHPDFL